jgi:hypothetical protein
MLATFYQFVTNTIQNNIFIFLVGTLDADNLGNMGICTKKGKEIKAEQNRYHDTGIAAAGSQAP